MSPWPVGPGVASTVGIHCWGTEGDWVTEDGRQCLGKDRGGWEEEGGNERVGRGLGGLGTLGHKAGCRIMRA